MAIKRIFNSWLRFIILCYFFLIDIGLKNNNIVLIKQYKNNFSPAVFGSTITFSVLSITILSIILDSQHSVFGVPFNIYSKYETFPIKFKAFFKITIETTFFSFISFLIDFKLTLIYLFIFILCWIYNHVKNYYDYLINKETIVSFLIKEETVKNYGEEIERYISNYLHTLEDFVGEESNKALNFYKEIKILREQGRITNEPNEYNK